MNATCLAKPDQGADWRGQPFSDDLIRSHIPRFRWFTHVNFGNGIVARPDSWPDAPEDWHHMGVPKFDYIVRRNLPDIQGKRVLDLGCNSGIIAIHLARLGAAEVVGVDREGDTPGDCSTGWHGWRDQVEFVKAVLEWRCNTTYNVRYVECDLGQLPELDLGRFDMVLALNCLYYLPEETIARVARHIASISDTVLVQCNTNDHRVALGTRATPAYMRRVFSENGFPNVTVDHPWDRPWKRIWPQRYFRPVVVGRKR